jgi:hypothetical protein
MSLFDLVTPTVANGMSLPRAMRALQSGEIPHPDATGDGLLGSVMAQADELPAAPAQRMSKATSAYIDQLHREAQEQEKVDTYEMRLRMAAKITHSEGRGILPGLAQPPHNRMMLRSR